MKYFTRVRERAVLSYSWVGRSDSLNRQLQVREYNGICIQYEGESVSHTISLGDYIFVKSDNDDRPYVAELLKLYNGGTKDQPTKLAEVRWFVWFEEIPKFKRKLLGREPHPQEIFLYAARDCDSEISAETILRPVKVLIIDPNEHFPSVKPSADALFVKLSWNGKAFNPLPSLSGKCSENPKSNGDSGGGGGKPGPGRLERNDNKTRKPTEVGAKSVPRSLGGERDTSRGLASLGPVSGGRASRSGVWAPKSRVSREDSASECSRSAEEKQRRTSVTAGKGCLVRKRLQLNSPNKSPGTKLKGQDVLCELLHDDEDDDDEDEDDGGDEEEEEEEEVVMKKEEEEAEKKKKDFDREPQTSKRKVIFKGLENEAVSSRKKLRCERPGELALTPIKQPALRAQAKVDVLCISPILLKSKADRSPSPARAQTTGRRSLHLHRKDSEIPGSLSRSHRSQTLKGESKGTPKRVKGEEEKAEAESATTRSRRSSARRCSMLLKKQLREDGHPDAGDASEDEFLPAADQGSESGSEDEELVERLTPRASARKSTPTTRRSAAKQPPSSRTPRSPRTPRQPVPAIPSRNQPTGRPASVMEEARARLHVSAVPESLPCREQEFQDVYNFVESKIIDGTGGCMYISGVPGTGKTATVQEVLRCLSHATRQEEIPGFQFIEINGMKLTDPHQAYVQILKLLTGQKATAEQAATLLEKRFHTPGPRRETTVLLVDELDLLWTRKQNVMYNLFDWPTRKQAKLVVLAIANTMDLPERIMMNRVSSRLGLTRMSFQPYTYKQLQQIIASRLNRLKAFEDDAIQLVARKVAALSGDARRALDICRRSAEICEFSLDQKLARGGLVRMLHVTQALDEMFSSPYITAIRNSSVQEQIFLRSIIAEFRRLGVEEATFQQVYRQHTGLSRMEGHQPPTVSEMMAVCMRLGACRLLLVESSKSDVHSRVRLNVSQDDVMYALKQD